MKLIAEDWNEAHDSGRYIYRDDSRTLLQMYRDAIYAFKWRPCHSGDWDCCGRTFITGWRPIKQLSHGGRNPVLYVEVNVAVDC